MEQNRNLSRTILVAVLCAVLGFAVGELFGRIRGGAGNNPSEVVQGSAAQASSEAGSKDLGEPSTSIDVPSSTTQDPTDTDPDDKTSTKNAAVERDESYYDVEHVVLYLDAFGELPPNYVTKAEARRAGWEGGSPERYIEGAAIGGDSFGNREGNLPKGTQYFEADIDTDGRDSRGAKRLVFSQDGHYYYTTDHYDTFTELSVVDGEVVWE